MTATGVCHTDLTMKAMWPQELSPVVLGHEGAGVVESVGARVTGIRPGDRVVLSYRSCGTCRQCAAGHQTYCHDLRTLNAAGSRPDGSTTMRRDGAPVYGSFFGRSSFASHALAYESNMVVVDQDVDLGVAAPLGCGVQTDAGVVLNVLEPGPGASLVIFRAGGVGLSAVMAAVPQAWRRSSPWTRSPAATHGLDTTAKGAVINQAVEVLAPRGMLALVGVGVPEIALDVRAVIGGGKTLRGVIEGDATPQDFLRRLLALHAEGRLPLEKRSGPTGSTRSTPRRRMPPAGEAVKPVLVF
jgi:aryl-alcohol dehydrogenase